MHVSELLKKAKRPLLHIGNGARGADWDIGIPIVTARNANDMVPWDHPLLVGRPGTFAQRGANFAVQTCDLYIAVGTRLTLTQTGYNSKDYARNATIVQVDIDQAELDKGTLRDPIKICMDAKQFFRELVVENTYPQWVARCQEWKRRYPVCLPEYREQKGSVNSYHFIDVLSELANEKDTIVTDMGFAFQNTHQGWKTKKGQRLLTNCGLAPMGWGLPAAIGAAFATNGRILLITGEGGLMMNIQELATVRHHQLNVKIFVLENGGYLTIKQTQQLGFEGRLMGVNKDSGLSFPDMEFIARAHGIAIKYLNDHSDLDYLGSILDGDYPMLCRVKMSHDQPQAPRAINRRNPDGSMNPTKLEDAFPYLSSETIAEEMKCAL